MCDIVGCDEKAEYEDEMQNTYCPDCMERAINEEEGVVPEDFEPIITGK